MGVRSDNCTGIRLTFERARVRIFMTVSVYDERRGIAMRIIKKNWKMLILMFVLLSFVIPAKAENISGRADGSVTFYVTTNSKWLSSKRVTLKQNGKGKAIGVKLIGGQKKYYSMYGRYKVTISYVKGNKTYKKTCSWTGKSKSFSLKKNQTYTFVVRPYSKLDMHTSFEALYKGFGFYGWYKTPGWKASCGSGASMSYPFSTTENGGSSVVYKNPYISIKTGSTGKKTMTVKADTYPASASVSWSSSDVGVASVSNGTVTAKGAGSAVITAKMIYGGKTYQDHIKVNVTGKKSVGKWSKWSFTPVSAAGSREVRTTNLYRYYYFLCPVCGGREPFQGLSDCHKYSLSLNNAVEGWFAVPYSDSSPKAYSYTKTKYYTTSLGDGKIWNFSAGNLYDTAAGTKDAGSSAEVIKKGYSYRTVYSNSCKISSLSR